MMAATCLKKVEWGIKATVSKKASSTKKKHGGTFYH